MNTVLAGYISMYQGYAIGSRPLGFSSPGSDFDWTFPYSHEAVDAIRLILIESRTPWRRGVAAQERSQVVDWFGFKDGSMNISFGYVHPQFYNRTVTEYSQALRMLNSYPGLRAVCTSLNKCDRYTMLGISYDMAPLPDCVHLRAACANRIASSYLADAQLFGVTYAQ